MIRYTASRPNHETGYRAPPRIPAPTERRKYTRADWVDAEQRIELLYDILKRTAELGEPCPTNKMLAERFGFASASGPPKMFDRLERAGRIKITRYGHGRVVEIIETGHKTQQPTDTRAHWRAGQPD